MNKKIKIGLIGAVVAAVVFFFWPASYNNWPITNENPDGSGIIAFGDSITRGMGVPESGNYPSQLSRAIGKPIINAGVNGHTTADGLRRLDRDVISRDPAIVLVCLGGNDILRRQHIDTQFNNLREIVGKIQASGALVVLIGVEGDGFVYRGDYGDRYEALAREMGCVYVPDILDGILGKSSLMVDNIHPNEAGYTKMVEKIERAAGKYLKQ